MDTYNGWANYPTWNVKLWLDNEQGSYEQVRDLAEQVRAQAPNDANVPDIWTAEQAARFRFADVLEAYVRDMVELEEASMASDLLGWALECVDWQEIADNVISELQEA